MKRNLSAHRNHFLLGLLGLLVLAGLFFIGTNWLFDRITSGTKMTLGVTFTPAYATTLGMEPHLLYQKIITDLGARQIRLPIYWNWVEPRMGRLDFRDTDYYVSLAEQKNVQLTIAIGQKAPRWPECYTPDWALKLTNLDRQAALDQYITNVVNRYKNSPALNTWQLENEPFHQFGICQPLTIQEFQREYQLVKNLDPNHPIMTVDSGEWGNWTQASSEVDILGVTLYRRTYLPYDPFAKFYQPPSFYRLKAAWIHLIHPKLPIIVSELQAEPWTEQPIKETSLDYQIKGFPAGDLKDNVDFVRQTGFNTAYLWGVEWWYYMQTQNHPEYVDQAKQLFQANN